MDTEPQNEQHEETVEHEVVQAEVHDDLDDYETSEASETKTVPLKAVQKERKRRQEAEAAAQRNAIELEYLKAQLSKPKVAEEDESEYESASRKELRDTASKTKDDVKRDLREEIWAESHSAQVEYVDENLATFLKQRPHLTSAIANAPNRYKEAYELMTALSPKQQARLSEKPKKRDAPHAPNSVPKSAGVNQAIDIMSLSDDEFNKWRASSRKKR